MLKNFYEYLQGRNDTNVIALIIVGSISWILTMFRSGSITQYGMGFWGPNGHDGVWHISIARALSSGKFELPIYAGASIKNYHIGFDLMLALLHKITLLPLTDLYFRFLPIIISLSIGFLLYKLLSLLQWDQSQIFWSIFFVYFGGNFAINFGGESTFWSQQSISTLINPPFALSLVFILVGLIFLQNKKLVLSAIFFGLLIQIKAYAAVIILGSLCVVSIYDFYKRKKLQLFKIFLVSSIISVLIFLPFNLHANSLFEFKPFWFLETMMQFSDRVGWMRYGEAMINYKLAGNLVKGIPAYIIAFLIFWYGNMGTRFLSEMYIAKFTFKKTEPNTIELIMLVSILIGVAMPMFFVQQGTAWNTIQFFYYSLFFSSILAGYVFSDIINNKKNIGFRKFFIIGILMFTLPTTYGTLKNVYLPNRPPAKVSNEELEALYFLEKQPDGIVLVSPFNQNDAVAAIDNPPRPLYLYESTAYVSAFAGKQVFLEDSVNLDITGVDWHLREAEIKEYFSRPNNKFLQDNNITYVYVPGRKHSLDLEQIFANDEVVIYKL